VIKCGPGLDSGIRGHGIGIECLTGIPMEAMAMLEEQEKCLTSELDGVRKRLEELRK
jgi:hypothetical protein